jgi:hypothetical protein
MFGLPDVKLFLLMANSPLIKCTQVHPSLERQLSPVLIARAEIAHISPNNDFEP